MRFKATSYISMFGRYYTVECTDMRDPLVGHMPEWYNDYRDKAETQADTERLNVLAHALDKSAFVDELSSGGEAMSLQEAQEAAMWEVECLDQ